VLIKIVRSRNFIFINFIKNSTIKIHALDDTNTWKPKFSSRNRNRTLTKRKGRTKTRKFNPNFDYFGKVLLIFQNDGISLKIIKKVKIDFTITGEYGHHDDEHE